MVRKVTRAEVARVSHGTGPDRSVIRKVRRNTRPTKPRKVYAEPEMIGLTEAEIGAHRAPRARSEGTRVIIPTSMLPTRAHPLRRPKHKDHDASMRHAYRDEFHNGPLKVECRTPYQKFVHKNKGLGLKEISRKWRALKNEARRALGWKPLKIRH